MTAFESKPDTEARDIFAGRIDLLYRLGRHYLSLPFAVLCIPIAVIAHAQAWLAIIPLMLQIAVVIAAEQLTAAYRNRAPPTDAVFWARRYVFVSAIAGATWGMGAWFWFVPNSYPAEAYLALAFLGMTATEFVARSAYRPAYLVHAALALTPLIVLLLLQNDLFAAMTALMILLFAAVLSTYCTSFARILDESLQLRRENARLVQTLKMENREAEAARDSAQASDRAKSAFIANISHELRTPLNALLGMTQLLDRAELDRPHRDHVKIMLEAGRGLETLLEDVITLTRTDGESDAARDCDPAKAVRTVVRLLQARAWEKHLRLTVSALANLPRVAADPRRVRQMLLKLADNALKFTERGGVDIRVEEDVLSDGRDAVRFSVADTGLGVPEDVAKTLYLPFVPGDNSYTRRQQGAGLGLSVVKRVTDAANGETGYHSETGEGSTFWFALPVARAAAMDAPPATETEVAPPSGLSLLVFAQEENLNRQLAHLLEPFGNQLLFATSIAGALARAGRGGFDMILVAAEYADTLAASPGLKAPILALLRAGERAPVSADQILCWPPTAQGLYTAIASIAPRAEQSGNATNHPGDVPIDAGAFAALEKSLGTATLIEILKSYIDSAAKLCDALDRASGEANWTEAARLAQDIAGSAGGLGLTAMTSVGRSLAQAAREGAPVEELRHTAQRIVSEHDRVCSSLANLYPDLVA